MYRTLSIARTIGILLTTIGTLALLASLAIFCVGCGGMPGPDGGSDSGVIPDGAMPDDGSIPSDSPDGGMTDQDAPNDGGSSGNMCAGLPLGPVNLRVVESTCDDASRRFFDAMFIANVAEASNPFDCSVTGEIQMVWCPVTGANVTLNAPFGRFNDGGVSSDADFRGCDAAPLSCHFVADSAMNDYRIDCGSCEMTLDLE